MIHPPVINAPSDSEHFNLRWESSNWLKDAFSSSAPILNGFDVHGDIQDSILFGVKLRREFRSRGRN